MADRELDTSHPDVSYLLEYVVDLEKELRNAHDYLEVCRKAAGARDGEMLLNAIRRNIPEQGRTSLSDPGGVPRLDQEND